jgi:hypothetical protein
MADIAQGIIGLLDNTHKRVKEEEFIALDKPSEEVKEAPISNKEDSVAWSQGHETASSLNPEEYQTSPYVLSSSDAIASAQYALSPSSDHQRSIESLPLASSVVSSLYTCDACLRSQVDVELNCKHRCCQRCFDNYLSDLDAVQGDTFQVKCFLPTCEEAIEEDDLKALLREDQLLKLVPKSMQCKCSEGRLEAVDDKCLGCSKCRRRQCIKCNQECGDYHRCFIEEQVEIREEETMVLSSSASVNRAQDTMMLCSRCNSVPFTALSCGHCLCRKCTEHYLSYQMLICTVPNCLGQVDQGALARAVSESKPIPKCPKCSGSLYEVNDDPYLKCDTCEQLYSSCNIPHIDQHISRADSIHSTPLVEVERESRLFCSCREGETVVELACSHSVCTSCCQAYVLEQHSSHSFNIKAVGCPLCMTVIPSSVMLNQIFISEADFKAKTRPMFECRLCLVKFKVEDSITLDCDHRFCESCIKDYISHLVTSDNVDSTKLVCPSHKCSQEISDTILHAHLSGEEFDKLVKFRLRRLFDSCPSGCGYVADIDDRERLFNCKTCIAVYCRDCKERTNEQHRCRVKDPEETKAESRRLIAEMGGKACPRCGEGLFLEKGCHFVKCPSSTCETYFCWLCESVRTLEEHYTHYLLGPFGGVCEGIQKADKKENLAFECSCRSPSQWKLPCSDIICARCFRFFVLSQVNSHGFSVERVPCPKCSSVLPQDVLNRLFGDDYLFGTALNMAVLDASNLVASCEKCFMPSPTYVKLSCDHILCYNCMQAKIDQINQSRNGSEMKCPVSICDTELSSADLSQFYAEPDVLRLEELRLKASQETKVWCPCCNNMNVIERDSTSLTCCYCSKKCCLLCNQESREFHDCQLQTDTRCPKCSKVLARNSCKYFYCSHCTTAGCRLCRQVISDLGEHFPSASGCINQRTQSVNSRPQPEQVKTTSVKAEFTCRCHKPAYTLLHSCDHSVCASCCQAYVLEQYSSPAFNIAAVGCPRCMTVIPSSVMLNQIFTSEADFKAKTRPTLPMFVCSLCLVEFIVEDSITLDCDHRFCESCIKDYISHLVTADNVDSTKLVCPSHKCSQEISDTILQAHLSEDEFDKLVKFRLRRLFDSCPSGCGYVADNDDRERLFNCINCRAVYCRDCKERTNEQHICRASYPEETKGESRKLIAEMGVKACPRCGEGLFLENGSNFVQCPSSTCLAYFCWLCEGVLTSGEYFTHYPQGSIGSVCVGMQEADRKLNRTFESSMPTTSQSKTESSQTSLEILARTEADKPRKSCPKCSFTKTKFGTANIQSCTKCQSYFCWLCEQALDYRQRLSHLDYRYSYCVGLQARDREKRASRLSHCACTAPVKLVLPCGHRSCQYCLLASALTTSDASQVKCSTCYAGVPRELLRSLKEEEQRKTTASLALFSNPYPKSCPNCNQSCINTFKKTTVKCSNCFKEFCWLCRALFSLTLKHSDHFVMIKGEKKCKYSNAGRPR